MNDLTISQRWYHLVITHSYSKIEWMLSIANSALRVYIDGKPVADTTLKYPDSHDVSFSVSFLIAQSLLTTALWEEPWYLITRFFTFQGDFFRNQSQNFRETSFYGEMGMFSLFSEVLTPAQVLELHQLGCDYVPNFYEKE